MACGEHKTGPEFSPYRDMEPAEDRCNGANRVTRKPTTRPTAAEPRGKRKLRRTLVTATCQFPFEEHPFSYVKTTRPQVYCDAHRVGWIDEDGVRHGDQHRVRTIRDGDGNVIGRKLVFEEPVPPELRRVYVGALRQEAARWLQELGLPIIGDLQPDPNTRAVPPGVRIDLPSKQSRRTASGHVFDWREVDRLTSPGVEAVVQALVLDDKGRPRFNPKLYRAATVDHEGTVEQPSLEPEERRIKVEGFEQEQNDHAAIVKQAERVVARDSARARAIPGAPTSKGSGELRVGPRARLDDEGYHVTAGAPGIAGERVVGLIPNATPLHVAIGRKLLGIARAVDWRLNREGKRRDALLYAEVEREVRLAITEARMMAALREASLVSPVQTSGRAGSPATAGKVQQ